MRVCINCVKTSLVGAGATKILTGNQTGVLTGGQFIVQQAPNKLVQGQQIITNTGTSIINVM